MGCSGEVGYFVQYLKNNNIWYSNSETIPQMFYEERQKFFKGDHFS